MGVRRLQTFMEQHCPSSAYTVRIQDLADEFRRLYDRDPVIVVDGSCCFRKLYGDLDWVCGGQFKEYVDIITKFIDSFECLGIKLVFYFDGATQESKRAVWVNRRLQSMAKAHSIFDALMAGCEVHQINKDLYVLPAGAGNVMSFIASTRCAVRRSIKECDEEIVNYAEANQCLAILAQDSDYVIYRHGAKYYLSSDHLNIDTMTTVAYDKFELARHLNLHVSALPIFASLMGNDHISADDLRPFHNRLTGRVRNQSYIGILVQRVAQYVHYLPPRNELFFHLRKISCEVFNTPNRTEDLWQSVLSYEGFSNSNDTIVVGEVNPAHKKWEKILSLAHANYIHMTSPSYIYNLLRELPFEMSTALEDCRIALPPSAVALRLMRQRIYGVLLRECPRKIQSGIIVNEWCASGPQSLNSALPVAAILPPDDSPQLLDLWQNNSPYLNGEKFKLLGWIVSSHLSSFDLRNFPQQIIPAICILSYLYHDAGILCDWEVRVFALVVVEVQATESKQLNKVTVKKVDVRGVQLATLFTRAITHLTLANSVCGNPLLTEWHGNLQQFRQICNSILQV